MRRRRGRTKREQHRRKKAEAEDTAAAQRRPEDVRRGPRVKPATAKFADVPIADSRKNALADKKRDEAIGPSSASSPSSRMATRRRRRCSGCRSCTGRNPCLYQLEMDRFLAAEKKTTGRGPRRRPRLPSRTIATQRETVPHGDHGHLRGHPEGLSNYPQRDRVHSSPWATTSTSWAGAGRPWPATRAHPGVSPLTQFVPDAYIQLGNHYFESNKLIPAKANYEGARLRRCRKSVSYAVYKLSWCDYNTGDYDAGLQKLHEVVDYARSSGLNDLRQRRSTT